MIFITYSNYHVCLSFKCRYNDIYSNQLIQLYYDSIQNKCVTLTVTL